MPFSQGHALVVGVGADLPNTVDDAKGLAKILCDKERCAYPAKQVAVLSGAKATRKGILAGLKEIARAATDESTIIIYFSGHGYRVQSKQETAYYLMPHGYDLDRLAETAIRDEEFTAGLKKIGAQKLLVLLDCCHAGGFENIKTPGVELAKAPIPPEAQKMLAAGNGRLVIASSREHELSYAGKPYSAFTQALTEALCGVNVAKKDGFVRVTDLTDHAARRVPQLTKDKQHPVLHFANADNFNVAYYAAGGQEPKALPFKTARIESEPGSGVLGPAIHIGTIQGDFNKADRDLYVSKVYAKKVKGGQYNVEGNATFNIDKRKQRGRQERD